MFVGTNLSYNFSYVTNRIYTFRICLLVLLFRIVFAGIFLCSENDWISNNIEKKVRKREKSWKYYRIECIFFFVFFASMYFRTENIHMNICAFIEEMWIIHLYFSYRCTFDRVSSCGCPLLLLSPYEVLRRSLVLVFRFFHFFIPIDPSKAVHTILSVQHSYGR